jgi:polysaccharide export outer membrane protein
LEDFHQMQPAKNLAHWITEKFFVAGAVFGFLALLTVGGTAQAAAAPAPQAPVIAAPAGQANYIIGPGDSLQVFVWKNAELSTTVPVRPDGRISIPLVEDIECAGKTPTQLARDLEERLKKYVVDPTVTVIVHGFVGPYTEQIRIVGEAAQPKALPYRSNMSVLDAMIEVGGLAKAASGNRATLVRRVNGQQTSTRIRLADLLEDGDLTANAALQPGDIIIIPQTFF